MLNPNGARQTTSATALTRRQVAWMLLFGLVSLPWLMGQSSCFLRSPIASKKKSYAQNAKQLHAYARKLLKGGNFQESRAAFQRIKTKYPFSSYATLADLGIGDAFFKGGKYLRSIDIYKLFTKLHPTHPKAAYAAFMVGEGYEKLRPWDWFLIPPAHQKDATHTRQAIQAFREFLQRFPKDKLVPQARKKMLFSLNLMAKHEMYVANYYRSKGQHRAVLWRMEFLIKKYPKVELAAEARFRMAESLSHLKEYDRAHETFLAVVKKHPKSRFAKDAKNEARKLQSKLKAKPKARKVAPRPAPARPAPAPVRPTPAPIRRAAPRPAPVRPTPRREAPAPRREEPAKRAAPAARREAPAARPVPAARREAPVARREAPAARREAPAARREAPVARREAPVARREAPVARREAPAARREAPAAKREAPAARREAPATRREAPAARREAPAARREAPAARREAPAPRKPAARKTEPTKANTPKPDSQPADKRPAARR